MARSRVIKPEFWSDEKVGELSYMERLLFIGMWNFADDEGLIKAHPSFLKANIFPYDDSLKPESIDKALGNLESKGIVYRYTNNNQKYIWIIKFRVYQRIDKPQKPMNPLPSIQNSGFAKVLFKRDNYICHLCKAEVSMAASLNEVDSSAPSIDHIVPKSKGGSNAPSNLATACISCNKRRGNTDLIIFQEDSENDIGTLTDEEKLKEVKEKESKEKEDADVFILPEDIKPEIWDAFIIHRKAFKKPFTEHAKKLLIEKLEKIGQDKNEVLNQAILKGWQDVFPLKEDNPLFQQPPQSEDPIEKAKRGMGL